MNTGKGMDVYIGPWVKALNFFPYSSYYLKGKALFLFFVGSVYECFGVF